MALGITQTVKNIADLLVERKLISKEDLAKAQETAKKEGALLEDALLGLKLMDGEELAKICGEVYGMPYVDLSTKKIPFIVLSKFPEEISRKYNIVVFETIDDQMVKVAVSRPWDPVTRKALDVLKNKNHINIDPYISSQNGLEVVLEQYKKPVMMARETGVAGGISGTPQDKGKEGSPTAPALDSKSPEDRAKEEKERKRREKEGEEAADAPLASLVKEDIKSNEELQKIIETSAVPRIVAAVIKYAVTMRASDIHIEPNDNADTRIRYRIDGVLHNIVNVPREDHPALVSRVKIMAQLKIDEQRVPQDGRINIVFGDREIDLRISTFPTINGEKVVMRILDKVGGVIQLESMGVTGRSFDQLLEAIRIPYGILLVTGPTGSGKSTTIYAILARLNKESVNIVTLEDPIEYQINGISQSQVKPYIGYSFAQGLRSILRQDPNVIMVGEIRDGETAEMAVQSALTGHLVLSTLHTNDSAGAIPRLIDMKVEPFLISSSLHTIIAQRLVRKVCPECRKTVKISSAILEDMKKEYDRIPEQYKKEILFDESKISAGTGCAKCNNSGYKGRLGVYELLRVTESVQKLTIQRASATDILNQAIKEGMITMKQDGVLKVLQGITTMEEVYRVTTI